MDTNAVIVDEASARDRRASRNLAAELRAVLDASPVTYDERRELFLVPSSKGRLAYEVVPGSLAGCFVAFCSCPAGRLGRQAPPGMLKCRHAAAVVRTLEKAGLARFDDADGRWHVPTLGGA